MAQQNISEDNHPIFEKIGNKTVTAADFDQLIHESAPECVRDRVRRRTVRNATSSHLDQDGHQQLSLPTFADRIQPKRERAPGTQMNGRGRNAHRHSARTQKRTMGESRRYMLNFDKAGYMNSLKEELQKRKFEEGVHYRIDGNILTLATGTTVDESLADWLKIVGNVERVGYVAPDIFAESLPDRFKPSAQFICENMGIPLNECESIIEQLGDKQALRAVAKKMMSAPGVNREWLASLGTV